MGVCVVEDQILGREGGGLGTGGGDGVFSRGGLNFQTFKYYPTGKLRFFMKRGCGGKGPVPVLVWFVV